MRAAMGTEDIHLSGVDSDESSKRDAIYAAVDPPPNMSKAVKVGSLIVHLVGLTVVIGGPFEEDAIRKWATWGYAASAWGVPRFYGLVVLFNLVLPSLLTQLYLAFGVVGTGRKKHGYKLPVMYASVDVHVEDVISGGTILSGGSAELAQSKLNAAVAYSCHQRAHHNALESLPIFLALSAVGGLRYPLLTAIHGFGWTVARVAWTRGYLSGAPPRRRARPCSHAPRALLTPRCPHRRLAHREVRQPVERLRLGRIPRRGGQRRRPRDRGARRPAVSLGPQAVLIRFVAVTIKDKFSN